MQITLDPAKHFPHLAKLVNRSESGRIGVTIHWDAIDFHSMLFTDMLLGRMTEVEIDQYLDQEADSPPPPGPEWAYVHHVLCKIGCFSGCPGPAV